jgi:TRAP-type mannitol/chloroaromatic compound transport system substrate-binding protein
MATRKMSSLLMSAGLILSLVLCAGFYGEAGAADPAVKKIVWKSSGHGPASDPSQIFHDNACKDITISSGGRLEVKPFVGGSIVPAYKELDAVHENVLQMAYTCPMYSLDKWPAAGLISSRPDALAGEALRTWFSYAGGVDLMNKMMEGYNVQTFPGWLSPLPEEVFLHSKVKITKVADLKGLRVRCMGDGGEVMKALGASVVIIPGGELYETMQRGVIDAFEYSTLASNWNMHFNEVAKYVILSPVRAPSDPQVFFVNKKAWAELPDDLKVLVKNTLDKWAQAEHEYLVAESMKAIDKFKQAGCEVYKLPKEVEDAVAAAAEKFYTDKSAKLKGIFEEIHTSMKNFGKAYTAMH